MVYGNWTNYLTCAFSAETWSFSYLSGGFVMRITIKKSGLVLYNQYGYKLYIYIYIYTYICIYIFVTVYFPFTPQPKEEKDNSEAATSLIQVQHVL